MAHNRAVRCLAVLVLSLPSSALRLRMAPRMVAADPATTALCSALQNGKTPDELGAFLCKSRNAGGFFRDYFSNEAWTVADATPPPSALFDSLTIAPPKVMEQVLMSIVTGAATSSERVLSRALVIVNALWESLPMLRQSCDALKYAVAAELGEEMPATWDGNFELMKDEWVIILSFAKYDRSSLGRIRDALELCGDSRKAP